MSSALQDISWILCKPKVRYLIHKHLPLAPILIQPNAIHYFPSHFFNIRFNTAPPYKPNSSKLPLVPTKILYAIFLCSMDRPSCNMAIIIQQDTTQYSLFKSINCSTYFGWYITPVHVSLMSYTVDTVLWAPDDGWNITRNMSSSW